MHIGRPVVVHVSWFWLCVCAGIEEKVQCSESEAVLGCQGKGLDFFFL